MDLKITVYKTTQHLLDNKECFRETINVVSDDFGYSNLIKAFRDVFGPLSVINFCIVV